MRRHVIFVASAWVLGLSGSAIAQQAKPDVLVEGPGIKVGEATVLHPRVGLEAGVVSNVFYEQDEGFASAIMRLLAGMDISPAGTDRLGEFENTARTLEFRAGVEFVYTEFLSSNSDARGQRNLGADAAVDATFFPQGSVKFRLADKFVRVARPVNFESDQHLDRDINQASAELTIQPRGRTLSGSLRYANMIDFFESDESRFANRIQHSFGARVNWKFFPYTQVWLDGQFSFIRSLEETNWKSGSSPLLIRTGIDSVLTEATTVNAYLGYTNGFYEVGPSYNRLLGGVMFGWRYTPAGRIVLGYRYDVQDSINANYYSQHVGSVGLQQQIRAIMLDGALAAHFRGYRGVPMEVRMDPQRDDRDDFILAAHTRGSWVLQDRFSLYLDYVLERLDTDFRTVDGDDPSYLRHEVVLGLGAAF